jgi:hypothetical protein
VQWVHGCIIADARRRCLLRGAARLPDGELRLGIPGRWGQGDLGLVYGWNLPTVSERMASHAHLSSE